MKEIERPLKFEEIEVNDWYWDNYKKVYIELLEVYEKEKLIPKTLFEEEHIEKEQTVLIVYPKNSKYGQTLKYRPDRFFKNKEYAEKWKSDYR